jgi:Trk K+ transport system NAD-binding subunit
MRARDLNPDLRIVVRMWEEQFAAQIRRFFDVQAVMSTTDLAAPSFAGSALGIEITQTLVIGDTEYSLIRLEVTPGSFLDGKTIGALEGEHAMDIVLHGQADDVQVHPRDDAQVHAGDTLVLFARHNKIMDVVARNQCRRTRQG